MTKHLWGNRLSVKVLVEESSGGGKHSIKYISFDLKSYIEVYECTFALYEIILEFNISTT